MSAGGEVRPCPDDTGSAEFEPLLADTSRDLLAASFGQHEAAIQRSLERVRLFFQMDCCAILSVSADRQAVRTCLASVGEGVAPLAPEAILAPTFRWSAHRLFVERQPIRISRIADLPPDADMERETWMQMSIRSVLHIPIETDGRVTYTVLLNNVCREYEWSDIVVTRLRLLGELIVSAMERHRVYITPRASEERTELAARSLEAGLWALDCRTGEYWMSERTRGIFGISQDESITLARLKGLAHPDDQEVFHVAIEKCLREALPFRVKHRIVRPDGLVRWLVSHGQPHCAVSGEPETVMGVSIEITESKEAEDALRTSNERLEAGADLAGLGFYEVDFTDASSYMDNRVRKLVGLPPDCQDERSVTSFWLAHIHPDDLQSFLDVRERMHAGKLDRISVEYRLLHPAGQKWIHHLARIVARDASGRAVQAHGVLCDITEWKQAEESLRQSYAEIERLKDRLQAEGEYLKAEMKLTQAHGPIVGQSTAITKLLRQVEQVAPTNSTALLSGETGTGKELVAAEIHRLSPRRRELMVKVNCAALPSGLVESELFGREKGAYTGALTRQTGRFEVADGSTLFLDEVGELSLDLQAKLLRVLESGEFERLGSTRTIKVNVRLIAATNRDLAEYIRQGRFREDLYYRLNVFPIRLPPLRERAEDIPSLVWAFLEELSARMGKKITRVPRKTMEALQRYPWPGNVRELRNVIEHGAIITPGNTLMVPKLEAEEADARTLAEAEREIILTTLKRTNWHIKGPRGAAKALGLNPATLYSRMKKLGIRPHTSMPSDG